MRIRPAAEPDLPVIREILAREIREGFAHFASEAPSVAELAAALRVPRYPWLVADDGGVAGYATSGPWKDRSAYRWTAEIGVYVRPERARAGVGRALAEAMVEALRARGFRTVLAGVALPNPASVGLLSALGFSPAGVLPGVGYKQGAWRDVGYWTLRLGGEVGAPNGIVDEVRALVEAQADPARAVREKAYLKSELRFVGLSLGQIHAVTRGLPRAAPLRETVEALWGQGIHELRAVAVDLLERRAKELGPGDLSWIEVLLREARTWAYVDAIAVHAVGSVVERHAEAAAVLDRWIDDPDFWIRRSAMLALLLPLRQGRGDPARLFRYAAAHLQEKEFFVRKAIGWVLREMARHRPSEVEAFVRAHRDEMSGVTLREAVKRLPEAARVELSRR